MARSQGEANAIRALVQQSRPGQRSGWRRIPRDEQWADFATNVKNANPGEINQAQQNFDGQLTNLRNTIRPLAVALRSRTQLLDVILGNAPQAGDYLILEWKIRPAGPIDDMIGVGGAACGCGCGCGCGG